MKLYTYTALTFGGEKIETTIDLSKIVALRKASGDKGTFHEVHCTGLRAPVELLAMPTSKVESAEEFQRGVDENYTALLTVWKAYTVRGTI